MVVSYRLLRAEWERLRNSTALVTIGGDWALALPSW
jgi:hypothetical protein